MRWTVGPVIIWFAINDPVTWIGEELFAVQRTDLFLRVLDFPHVGAQQIAADNSAISTSVNQRHFLCDLDRRGVIRGSENGPILEGARLPPCRGTADSG